MSEPKKVSGVTANIESLNTAVECLKTIISTLNEKLDLLYVRQIDFDAKLKDVTFSASEREKILAMTVQLSEHIERVCYWFKRICVSIAGMATFAASVAVIGHNFGWW